MICFRIINDATKEHAYDGLLWTLRYAALNYRHSFLFLFFFWLYMLSTSIEEIISSNSVLCHFQYLVTFSQTSSV